MAPSSTFLTAAAAAAAAGAAILLLLLLPASAQPSPAPSPAPDPSSCPLNLTLLAPFLSATSYSADPASRCAFAKQCILLLLSDYFRSTSLFLLPSAAASSACFLSLRSALAPALPSSNFSFSSTCGFPPDALSVGCMNITTRRHFESLVAPSALADMNSMCNQPLQPVPTCTGCSASLGRVKAGYLPGPDPPGDNITGCSNYPFFYAGAVSNKFGPADPGTAFCLFLLTASNSSSPPPPAGGGSGSSSWVYGVVAACVVLVGVAVWVFVVWFLRRKKRRERRRAAAAAAAAATATDNSSKSQALESISASTTLIKFTYDEIKAATRNFSRDFIIGKGGYGNVYRGTLKDGTAVAVKRFKNCSAAGDDAFAHEVEVIASIRHVNLLTLHGYCIATTQREGHQRIIVCDLMEKGSLHDHLFDSEERQLTWPLRQKIAVGMARGLAYLHYGAQPAIIHRDIKASNILLDEDFEAKVGDFGLAKFAPEGATHLSTRVAGTMGYVAPEYALYGQLTEKSDVYSFGIVLLELLSGRKAFTSLGEGQSFVLSDWAWSLVRQGQTLDIIQEGMEEIGAPELLEKYAHVAVLCTHPQLHARPTMDQVVNILETEMAMVPAIPDRPMSCMSNLDDIGRSMSNVSGSGYLSSPTGFQFYSYDDENVGSKSRRD